MRRVGEQRDQVDEGPPIPHFDRWRGGVLSPVMTGKQPNLVVYMELVEGRARVGKKQYIRGVTSVEQE